MIHILYDPRRDDEPLLRELERQKITDYCFWYPEKADSVVKSINLSHKQIVRYLKEKGFLFGTIFEEDVMFPSAKGFDYYMRFVEECGDVDIALGGAYACGMRAGVPVSGSWRGLHCYTIFERFYDKFLGLPANDHIDKLVSDYSVSALCYPMAALQRAGVSANQRCYVDYNVTLGWDDVYR